MVNFAPFIPEHLYWHLNSWSRYDMANAFLFCYLSMFRRFRFIRFKCWISVHMSYNRTDNWLNWFTVQGAVKAIRERFTKWIIFGVHTIGNTAFTHKICSMYLLNTLNKSWVWRIHRYKHSYYEKERHKSLSWQKIYWLRHGSDLADSRKYNLHNSQVQMCQEALPRFGR